MNEDFQQQLLQSIIAGDKPSNDSLASALLQNDGGKRLALYYRTGIINPTQRMIDRAENRMYNTTIKILVIGAITLIVASVFIYWLKKRK